ncbi:Uncharacterized protein BM_BM3602 [Brugia malayi]|uniref:ACB domain-containing protein n=2 Tax=Brugia malayi TaxID=6279 RepID=A0A4E9F928_BRUMA|nr:Uncharacterized protein BM_BM3602 [Brugia malayi]VIO90409.1 Uncharacterized protein BM_BM3602 [Brugia malayi]
MREDFYNSVMKYKKMRARFDQRQELKNEYELLIKFDEHTYDLFGLYQQAIVGDINVPKINYRDPNEMSYMWSWIKGNRKWHAWNKCKDKNAWIPEEEAEQFHKFMEQAKHERRERDALKRQKEIEDGMWDE